jgi:hypothetical protein
VKVAARPSLLAGGILVLAGAACLVAAPLAAACVTSGDATTCETAGTIALNVVGFALAAGGIVIGAFGILRARSR